MIINIESLPRHIYNKLPLSIKTYKKEYELSELPFHIQALITGYEKKEIKYTGTVYDVTPNISEYGDFKIVDNLTDLIVEYISNYFKTSRSEYPFNGLVGSNIKRILQTKDTSLQNLKMNEEVGNMIETFNLTRNYKNKVKVQNFEIKKKKFESHVEYYILLNLIVDDQPKKINIEYVI